MRDPLVESLARLIQREGGREKVADEIKSSEQTLYQIIKGVKDSRTGTPKGVGPSLRKRLDERYPGWRDLSASEGIKEPSTEPTPAHAIQRFMEALDPVLAPSAREVLHLLVDGELNAERAASDLERIFTLSNSDINNGLKKNRSSLDLPSDNGRVRGTKFATR